MAILTPLSPDDARRIGALYGLTIVGTRGILAGSVNSNYALELDGGGRVFLRVYEEQGSTAASREARMLDRLCAGGVLTPRPLLRRDGKGFVAEHAGKPAALFPWVSGEALCSARVTPDAARRVGEALAQVHLAGIAFEEAPRSRFGLGALESRLQGLRGADLADELQTAIGALRDDLARVRRDAEQLGPPAEVLIHGDLFRDNVLWEGDEISALLDFESASRGSASFDLAVTMLAWCFGDDLDARLAGALAAGYVSVRPLAAEERGRMFHESERAALRFAITRITDFEVRPSGCTIYKDYRRFVARQRALERLGSEGLLQMLRL